MNDIFISYSSKDTAIANAVCRYLERHGLNCWIFERNKDFGENYMSKINSAIRNSRAFVVLVSTNSINSEQVANEIAIANSEIKNGMKRFPILLDSNLNPDHLDGALGYALTGIHMCNWNDPQEQKQLIKQIGAELELELNPSTGRFEHENSYFYARYNPMPEEPVYTSESPEDVEPIDSVEETLFANHSREKIRKSQISILVLLLLFFLGATFLLCGSAQFLSYEYEDFVYITDAVDYLGIQIRNLFIGGILLLVCWKLPVNFFKKMIPYLTGACLISICLVNEYSPWISLGGFYLSPINLGTFCLILLFAWCITKKSFKHTEKSVYRFQQDIDNKWYSFLLWAIAEIYFLLSFIKFGMFMALLPLVIALAISFTFSNKKKYYYILTTGITIACLLFIIAVLNGAAAAWGMDDHVLEYLRYQLTPPEAITNAIQATTFGSSGFSNDIFTSLRSSILNDNIFVLIFHMGWSVAITVVLMYGFLLFHIYRIGKICADAKNYFESAVCFGVLFHIAFCAGYHMCMNLNLLPIMGCPLPFISDWGNEFLFAEIGCVLAAGHKILKRPNAIVTIET